MPGLVDIDGLNALKAALISLPDVTEAAGQRGIDQWTALEQGQVSTAASRVDKQARLAARSVKGGQGRLTAGGPGRLPNGHGTYGDLFWGAEFGGGSRPETRQFRPYNPRGYWFFPTVESDETTTLMDAAAEGLQAAADRWDN